MSRRAAGGTQSRRLIAGVAGTALCIGAGGVLLGDIAVSDREQTAHRRPSGPSISTPHFRLIAPPGWSRSNDASTLPGLTSSSKLSLVHRASGTRLVAAWVPASSPTLLPAPLVERIDELPGQPQSVRLGGGFSAYHYRALSLPDESRFRIDVFAAPTTDGVATVACVSDVAALTAPFAGCLAAARSLRVTRGAPVPLSQNTAFWLRIDSEMRIVDAKREQARTRLAIADTPKEQEAAMLSVARVYGRAAAVVAPLAQYSPAPLAIVAQLRGNAATFRRISTDLKHQSTAALARDRQKALSGEARLKVLLSERGIPVPK